ncbi:hypothetical protein KNSL1_013285 [Colletotrichum chrysophilum]|nr:hypothetical protein KNSL1_013285 [Colletotrichum chrysophilum]
MMKYHENLIRLLDPIVTDNDSLMELIRNPDDSRWKDGSLEALLENRLSSGLDRFFRTIKRMQDVMMDLNKLLQIQDGKVGCSGDGAPEASSVVLVWGTGEKNSSSLKPKAHEVVIQTVEPKVSTPSADVKAVHGSANLSKLQSITDDKLQYSKIAIETRLTNDFTYQPESQERHIRGAHSCHIGYNLRG